MSFLAPAFLAALLALAIPVLVHLVRRNEPRTMPFPSAMMLERSSMETTAKRRLRDWPLLLLRCLALIALVLAFAQPFFERADTALGAATTRTDRVIVVDRSYSTSFGDVFARVRGAAETALANSSNADRVALVVFDSSAQTLAELSLDHKNVATLIADLAPGNAVTDVASGLRRAQQLLKSSTVAQREIVLISDFQKNGVQLPNAPQIDEATVLTVIPVTQSTDATSAAVTGVSLTPFVEDGREHIAVTVRVARTARESASKLAVTLEVDGREAGKADAVFGEDGVSASARFEVLRPGAASVKVRASIEADALRADDEYFAVLHTTPAINVLIVEPENARARHSFFLTQALAVSTAARFDVLRRDLVSATPQEISAADVIVLNETRPPGGNAGLALGKALSTNKGILVVVGDTPADAWPSDGALSIKSSSAVTQADALRLRVTESAHPAFAVFSNLAQDLSTVEVVSYHPLSLADTDTALLRYSDGAPALVERTVQGISTDDAAGRVLVLNTSIDTAKSNLPLSSVFVPLVVNTLSYLASHETAQQAFTVGDAVDVARYLRATGSHQAGDGDIFVQTPSGQALELKAARATVNVTEPGWYNVRKGNAPPGLIAVNVNPKESDLTPFGNVGNFANELKTSSQASAEQTGQDPELITSTDDTTGLWWYLLLLGLGLLALETVLSNGLSQRRAAHA